MKEILSRLAGEYGIPLTGEMLRQFERYQDMLAEWNAKINLTAITRPEEVAVKHFLDSLLPLKAWGFPPGATLLDVGTGAGFPGVPLKIARPDLSLTLMDSLGKRVVFLEELSRSLGQENAVRHMRAEEAGRDGAFRERFDLVTARAVARLTTLCEYCLPLVKAGGVFLALKGPGAEEELIQAGNAISLLGGETKGVFSFRLPGDEARRILVIQKISQTPTKYPRRQDKISKAPL